MYTQCLIALLTSLPVLAADPSLLAIMGGNKAALSFDGRRVTLAVGESAQGVKLIAVQDEAVVIETGGKRSTVRLGQSFYAASASTASPQANQAVLYDAGNGHFMAELSARGDMVRGMIDTGATALALSAGQAQQLGVPIDHSRPVVVTTAQGRDVGWRVTVPELRLAGMTVYNVEAIVSRGDFPVVPLIGMTVLNHFTLQRDGDQMTLVKKF
jgi:aspartyl protease family protein